MTALFGVMRCGWLIRNFKRIEVGRTFVILLIFDAAFENLIGEGETEE